MGRLLLQRPRRSVAALLPALALPALALAGCSGTPLGEQLSRSFSAPPPAAPSPAANPDQGSRPGGPRTGAASTNPRAGGTGPGGAASPPRITPPTVPPAAPPAPLAPVPYRVTLKLPAADPSAPAEALTRALRNAGVSFEVETIERVPPGGATAPLQATPAPPPR